MQMLVFSMEITNRENDTFFIRINNNIENANISFNPYTKQLTFIDENNLSKYLHKNEYQLRKLLHNKRIDTYFVGFKLVFVFRDKKNVAAFNDKIKIVVLDRRNNKNASYVVSKKGKTKIYKLYIDGSFSEKNKIGAYTIIIKDLDGKYRQHSEKIVEKGSCQTELQAAIKGLKLLESVDFIRIISDSIYVRKGLTEWIMYWKLNDWKTANGEEVKNIENWMIFDKLTENKYIEFQWVKGHSNHFENTLCDLYSREIIKKSTSV